MVVSWCSGGAVEEHERHFSFLHLSVCSVWSVSLSGGNRPELGTHLGLDRSGPVVCVLDGGVPTVV